MRWLGAEVALQASRCVGIFRNAAPRLTWWAAWGSGLGAALARRLKSPAGAMDLAGSAVSALCEEGAEYAQAEYSTGQLVFW